LINTKLLETLKPSVSLKFREFSVNQVNFCQSKMSEFEAGSGSKMEVEAEKVGSY
jgi:hypothetical protein